jgi:hypothetical protein
MPSPASDVWSFAITILECLSLQDMPAREDDRHPCVNCCDRTLMADNVLQVSLDSLCA